ncbi:MAG: hypothetical protein JXA96_17105 [Sedimentisphaerales bacterium]|nr:hypothetical protein [Sedimentisphaerales bacterium]
MENVFTGLGHLEGEEVAIQGTTVDDVTREYPRETVSGAQVTTMVLSPHAHNFVRKTVIGLPYRSTLEPMRLDATTDIETTKGLKARIPEVVVSFLNTLGAQYGKDTDNLKNFTGKGNEFGTSLYTGDLTANLNAGYGEEDHFVVSTDAPLPCTIRAIIPKKEITD